MKVMVRRACGHEEKIKIYPGGAIKSEVIASREALKRCRECGKNTTPKGK